MRASVFKGLVIFGSGQSKFAYPTRDSELLGWVLFVFDLCRSVEAYTRRGHIFREREVFAVHPPIVVDGDFVVTVETAGPKATCCVGLPLLPCPPLVKY
jgi:hypothetical protein